MDLNQVTLEVADFDASIDFYQRLGLRMIVRTDHGYARFEAPSGTTLSVHTAPSPEPSSTVLYFEVDNVDAVYADLVANGIAFESPPQDMRWLWREARFRDPTGHPFCLYHAGDARRFPPWRLEDAEGA